MDTADEGNVRGAIDEQSHPGGADLRPEKKRGARTRRGERAAKKRAADDGSGGGPRGGRKNRPSGGARAPAAAAAPAPADGAYGYMRRDARDALSRAMTDAFPETSLERARGTSLLLEACVSDKAAAAGDGQYHRRISTLVQSFGRWKKRCPALRRIHKFAAIGPDRDAAIGAAAEAGAWELAPDALRLQAAWLRDAERASARADASANAPFSGGTCEGVACKRCHKMNVSSHREQRRAADEPETEIFVCKSCGLQWTAR